MPLPAVLVRPENRAIVVVDLGHDVEKVIGPRRYQVEFRRKVLDLIEAGKPVVEIAARSG